MPAQSVYWRGEAERRKINPRLVPAWLTQDRRGGKARTDTWRLSSDRHMCAVAHTPTHKNRYIQVYHTHTHIHRERETAII